MILYDFGFVLPRLKSFVVLKSLPILKFAAKIGNLERTETAGG